MFALARKVLLFVFAFSSQASWALKDQSACVVKTNDAYQTLLPEPQALALKFAIMESVEGKLMVVPIQNAHETAIYWGFVGALASSKDFVPATIKKFTPEVLRDLYAQLLLGVAKEDLAQAALSVQVVLGPDKNQALIQDYFGGAENAKTLFNKYIPAGIFYLARLKVPYLKQDMTWGKTEIAVVCE